MFEIGNIYLRDEVYYLTVGEDKLITFCEGDFIIIVQDRTPEFKLVKFSLKYLSWIWGTSCNSISDLFMKINPIEKTGRNSPGTSRYREEFVKISHRFHPKDTM